MSNLADLQGASLGPIKNLGAPDGLLVIGGIAINLLPVLMTLVNVISSAIYLKGFPLKTKLQIYGMALFFLVFLYSSPSGLVFYWTLNNVFSLGKTIYYKLKNSKIVMLILFPANIHRKSNKTLIRPNKRIFIAGSLFLTSLVGALIPSTVISASPLEFVDITSFYNPIWYIVSSTCLATGTFLIWLRVFYWLATPKIKVLFDKGVWILSGIMIINYMFFGTNLGNLLPSLQYENKFSFTLKEIIINIVVIYSAAIILYLIVKKWDKFVTNVLIVAVAAMSVMSLVNFSTINSAIKTLSFDDNAAAPHFQLDKEGKNVVVVMLDRAMGEYVPYIFNEKAELKEKFEGFTYYSNTISYGDHTNFGVPALLGGYEYTPVEMNKRDKELLVDKHNEALKVMPALFSNNGYNVTVCDPPYANYSWIPDLSIYDDYSKIDTYITKGIFKDDEIKQKSIDATSRNFFCFSLMKCMPPMIQPIFYQDGSYSMTDGISLLQVCYTKDFAKGYVKGFVESYNILRNLSSMSEITNSAENNFLFISNDITHEPALLQAPDYTPEYVIDNRLYEQEHANRFVLPDGRKLNVSNLAQMRHYHANMASLIQIGNWLDFLKENDVYDNTKIIIVADHGYTLFQSDELRFTDSEFSKTCSVEGFFPLLMVKDFNSHKFTTSNEFMTNADVPTLAFDGTIHNPINPFTGKSINNKEKYAHDQFIIVSDSWDTNVNNGTTFLPDRWISVKDDIWDKDNWDFHSEETVLKENSFS